MKDHNEVWLYRWKGEGLLAWIKRRLKYRLQHVRYRDVVVDRKTGETARWYPDHAGGVLHHPRWWALVKSHELESLPERFASDERDFHICKIKKWTESERRKLLLDLKYNPLEDSGCIYVPCGICRSTSCCRPDEHGITAAYEAMKALM